MAAFRALTGGSRLSTAITSASKLVCRDFPRREGPQIPNYSTGGQASNLQVEVSSEDFKYVERLLPVTIVPDPPKHAVYPTPSGWVPPRACALELSYQVRRTKNHMLPVYLEDRNGGTRKLILIKKVEGNIWALEKDLREYLQELTGKLKIATQVNEITRHIRVKGLYQREVADFLLKKGF